MVDHWSKGWPYTPYILMRQSSFQNMHGQWLRDLVTFMPRRCQRPERKLALHRFLHTPLSKESNNFSERLLYSWSSKNLFCGPNFGNNSTCVLEVFRKRAGGGGGGIVAYEYKSRFKIVASFFLPRFLLSVSIGAIFMHTSIFIRLRGGGGRIFWIWGLPKSHKYIHVHVSKIPCIYTYINLLENF